VRAEVYNYFRDYDPGVGRYTESDPTGLAAGLNTYLYALAEPLMLVDRVSFPAA
jgi:RHS repeat-associated protein